MWVLTCLCLFGWLVWFGLLLQIILLWIFFNTCKIFSWVYLGILPLGHGDAHPTSATLLSNANSFSKVVLPVYLPIRSAWMMWNRHIFTSVVMEMIRHLVVIVICVSLVANEVNIFTSSFGKFLFRIFAPFSIKLFTIFLLVYWWSFYTLDTDPFKLHVLKIPSLTLWFDFFVLILLLLFNPFEFIKLFLSHFFKEIF